MLLAPDLNCESTQSRSFCTPRQAAMSPCKEQRGGQVEGSPSLCYPSLLALIHRLLPPPLPLLPPCSLFLLCVGLRKRKQGS